MSSSPTYVQAESTNIQTLPTGLAILDLERVELTLTDGEKITAHRMHVEVCDEKADEAK